MNKEIEHIPVLIGQDPSILNDTYANNYLVNAISIKNLKTSLKSNKWSICDSGGFQIITGKVDYLDPLEILKIEEFHANAGFILDYPPIEMSSDKQIGMFAGKSVSDKKFEDCLNKSVRNSKLMYKYKSSNFRLYNILHGDSYERLDRWFKAIDNNDNSWAVAPKPPSNRLLMSTQMIYLFENIAHPFDLHVLGTSSKKSWIVFKYLINLFGYNAVKYSYDNSTAIKCSTQGVIAFCSFSSSTKMLKDDKSISIEDRYKIIVDNEVMALREVSLCSNNNLRDIITDKEILYVFDFIDYAKEHGLKEAYKKYYKNVEFDNNILKQRNIFSY